MRLLQRSAIECPWPLSWALRVNRFDLEGFPRCDTPFGGAFLRNVAVCLSLGVPAFLDQIRLLTLVGLVGVLSVSNG